MALDPTELNKFSKIAESTLSISDRESTYTHVYQLMWGLGAVPGAITGTVDFIVNHFFIYELLNVTPTLLAPILVSLGSFAGLGLVGTGIGLYNAHYFLDSEKKTIQEIERGFFIILNRAADEMGFLNDSDNILIEKRVAAIHQFLTTSTYPDLENTGLTRAALEMLAHFKNYFDESDAPHHLHLLCEIVQEFARFRDKPEHTHLKLLWENWKKCNYHNDEQMCEVFTKNNTTEDIFNYLRNELLKEISPLKNKIHRLIKNVNNHLHTEAMTEIAKNELVSLDETLKKILAFLEETESSEFKTRAQMENAIQTIQDCLPGLTENLHEANLVLLPKILQIKYYLDLTIKSEIKKMDDWLKNKDQNPSFLNLDADIYFGKDKDFQKFLIDRSGVLFKHKGTPESKLDLLWRALGIGIGIFAAGQLLYNGIMVLCVAATFSAVGVYVILGALSVFLTALAMKCYLHVKKKSDNRELIKTHVHSIMKNYANHDLIKKAHSVQGVEEVDLSEQSSPALSPHRFFSLPPSPNGAPLSSPANDADEYNPLIPLLGAGGSEQQP